MKKNIESLCICLTPLHVLIAQKIYEKKGVKFSKGIYLSYLDNNKNRFYADEMHQFCESTELILLPSEASYFCPKHLHIFIRRLYFRIKFSAYSNVSTIYTGTSINHYLYALLSGLKFNHLVTYDDGVENIKANSVLKTKEKFSAKLFLLSSGITYWRDKLISESSLHYSIYNGTNVYEKTEKIEFLSATFPIQQHVQPSKVVKIFLGPPPEVSSSVEEVISKSILAIKPDGYIAHPREVNFRNEVLTYINTNLVAEHYILNLLNNEPAVSCEVYGYEGSALLNLASIPRIKVVSVMESEPDKKNIREMMKSYGINFLHS
jgi:hypothetical protein